MGKINLKGIRFWAFHGCFHEEQEVGNEFLVDVEVDYDFSEAAKQDDLTKTIDYVTIYDIVKKEMGTKAKLIENVALRIKENMESTFKGMNSLTIKIAKQIPPVGGETREVVVEVSEDYTNN
ncbi:dihydroneopterin aldolase [bacterium AH-315-C07]|nr:dihydroneopterin aldolase [bacterium AH-315-C07]